MKDISVTTKVMPQEEKAVADHGKVQGMKYSNILCLLKYLDNWKLCYFHFYSNKIRIRFLQVTYLWTIYTVRIKLKKTLVMRKHVQISP